SSSFYPRAEFAAARSPPRARAPVAVEDPRPPRPMRVASRMPTPRRQAERAAGAHERRWHAQAFHLPSPRIAATAGRRCADRPSPPLPRRVVPERLPWFSEFVAGASSGRRPCGLTNIRSCSRMATDARARQYWDIEGRGQMAGALDGLVVIDL